MVTAAAGMAKGQAKVSVHRGAGVHQTTLIQKDQVGGLNWL